MASKTWIGTGSNTTFTATSNWSDGAAPANNDTLYFTGLATGNVAAGLSNSGLTGITLVIDQAYTGQIGTISGATVTPLTLGSGLTATIGKPSAAGSGSGSPQIILATTTSATINVLDSASTSSTTYYPPVCLSGPMTLNMQGGIVGVGVLPGMTASGTFNLSDGPGSQDATLTLGDGVTASGGITVNAGTVVSHSSATTASVVVDGQNATYTFDGTGAHTTVTVNQGTCYYDGSGTITTATVYDTLDFSRDPRSRTVTNCTVHDGATLNVDNGTAGGIVFTNPVYFPDGISNVTLTAPRGIKFNPVAGP